MESGVPKWARTLLISLIAAVCAAGIVAGICVAVFSQQIRQVGCGPSGNCNDYSVPHPLQRSNDAGDVTIDEHTIDPALLPAPSSSLMKKYKLAAVAVDSLECSTVGRNILERGGNAVDAAVATLFCNGVVTSQSMGIGGGFIMTISLSNGTRFAVVAREIAPGLAHHNMFNGTSSLLGPLAAGVPGEVLGLWEAKQRLGNPDIPWSDLVQPSIDLCRNGITVSAHAANALNITKSSWKEDPGMRSVFLTSDGNILKEGDVYKHPLLAQTLEQIAQKGGDEFYKGDIAEKLVDDIQKSGGIITMEDMKNYRVSWEEPVTAKIPGTEFTILSSPPPGSGSVMAAILGIAGAYKPNPLDRGDPLLWHRFVEACKFAYAKRTMLGDWQSADVRDSVRSVVMNLTSESWITDTVHKISDEKTFDSPEHYGADFYNVEDHGTSHISILSPAGDAVSVTSTINLLYGSKFMSPSTGVILNNQMDDFSYPGTINYFGVPPSPTNFPTPGKRPVSSMSPTIVLNEKKKVLAVVGASGGTKITTSVAQVLLRLFFLGEDVKSAVDSRRIHHQLMPMKVVYETGTTRWIADGLKKFGHSLERHVIGGASVQAIVVDRNTGDITANADFRKGGTTDGF